MLLAFILTYAIFGLMFAIAITVMVITEKEKFSSVVTDDNRGIVIFLLCFLSVFIWPYFLWKAGQ